MLANTPLVIAFLTGLSILMLFLAFWLLFRKQDSVDQRLVNYNSDTAVDLAGSAIRSDASKRYQTSTLSRLLSGFGLGPRLALALTRADIPMTATEYTLIILILGWTGFAIGTWRVNALLGLGLGMLLGSVPLMVIRYRRRRRIRDFNRQLPDMLTLLIGALRAGFGLSQALDLLVQRLGSPASDEIANVTQAVNLGVSMKRALEDSASRMGSDDYNLIVVAITVQSESGGNLAETLGIIAETVRHRLHILTEIRVLTAQQRFTGYALALLPILAALALFLINPEYMTKLFEPGVMRILAISVVLMQVLGFLIIQRIVDIEV